MGPEGASEAPVQAEGERERGSADYRLPIQIEFVEKAKDEQVIVSKGNTECGNIRREAVWWQKSHSRL